MIVFFIHPSAPAQYRHLVKAHADRGDQVYFICREIVERVDGVEYLSYLAPRLPKTDASNRLSLNFQLATLCGERVAASCEALKARGITPDVIHGHGGWGDLLYVKDVYPNVPLACYSEYYYHPTGLDLGFDPEFDPVFLEPKILQARNASIALTALRADINLTPTRWQKSVLPPALAASTRVLHEGIDTREAQADEQAVFQVPGTALQLRKTDQVITYVSRSLEPYRGFHTFMRSLPTVLAANPRAQVLIVGAENTTYGGTLSAGDSYKKLLLSELSGRIDLSRVHFCGSIPRQAFIRLLQVSSAHVYLSYPLFISWSCLEALASSCLVIGSKTGPVMDVIEDRHNGLLVDFFRPDELSAALNEVLRSPKAFQPIRKKARQSIVKRFDLHQRCLPEWLALSGTLAKLS